MVLNNKGEVADFLDVSQFSPGKSAYMCVAYSAALIKYAGLPGHGPTGTVLEASNLACYWYGREEGGNSAANQNGMSVTAMEDMLKGMGMSYYVEELQDTAYNIALINLALREGMPCIVCGHENSFFDLDLGDRVPYNWTPTGNHAIVVSGVDSNGNLLVHDCANVDQQGHIRPGPRTYDAATMQLVSVTSVQIGEEMPQPLKITDPAVAALFVDATTDPAHPAWKSKMTGRVLHDALLKDYIAGGQYSLDYLGDVVSPEIPLGGGSTAQFYAHGARMWNAAAGKVEPFDVFSQAGQDILRQLLSVPVPVPEVPQDHAALLQLAEQAAAAVGKKLV